MALSPPQEEQDGVSGPAKRIRWATRRVTGKTGDRKRESLLARVAHKRTASAEKKEAAKRASTADTDPSFMKGEDGSELEPEQQSAAVGYGRRVFFNIPLPDDARDDDGHPLAHFSRNKIRTAKYTPISFFPKNMWFQFHNVANVYFLFIIILGVSNASCP